MGLSKQLSFWEQIFKDFKEAGPGTKSFLTLVLMGFSLFFLVLFIGNPVVFLFFGIPIGVWYGLKKVYEKMDDNV